MKYLKLFEKENNNLHDKINDYFINFIDDESLEFLDDSKNRLCLGYYLTNDNLNLKEYDDSLKEWIKLYNRFMHQLKLFTNEYKVEVIEFKSLNPFGIELTIIERSNKMLFECEYYSVDINNNVFFHKEKLISFCQEKNLNVKITLEEWNDKYALEIKSQQSYSRTQSDSMNLVKSLFINFGTYKEYDFVSSTRDSSYNKPVELYIFLKDIKGQYFLD